MAAQTIAITSSQVTNFCAAVEACIGSSAFYAQNIGNGSAVSYTVSHNFGTRDVMVQAYDNAAPYDTVTLEVQRTSTNALTLLSSADFNIAILPPLLCPNKEILEVSISPLSS